MPARDEQKPARSRLASVISGSVAGGIVSMAIQPLDVVRTRMQGDAAKGVVRGPFAAAKVVLSEGGALNIWRGTGPSVIRVSVGAGIHFFILETVKGVFSKMQPEGQEIGPIGNALIGGLSRGFSTMAMCPITVIKTRMEYKQTPYRSTLHALSTISKVEGARGLFAGLVPTLMTTAPFSALHYMFYRHLQTRFQSKDNPSVYTNFVCGTVAAAAATVLTQPADVVRARMQLGLGASGSWASITTLRDVVAKQGLAGIMTGAAPRMLKRTLQTALIWTMYEELAPILTKAIRGHTA